MPLENFAFEKSKAFYMEAIIMEYQEGYLYILKDSYFELINDSNLKMNKNSSRPHYYAYFDKELDLLWMIPLSSKVEKYERLLSLLNEHSLKYKSIKIIHIFNKKSVFLLQDMFPIEKDFIDRYYTKKGLNVSLTNESDKKELNKAIKLVIKALKNNVKFTSTAPDINNIILKMNEYKKSKRNIN